MSLSLSLSMKPEKSMITLPLRSKKYHFQCPFQRKRILFTTVTTDPTHLEKWVKKEETDAQQIFGFNIHTSYREEAFLNTLTLSTGGNTMIYQKLSEHHGNTNEFKGFPLKLIHLLLNENTVLVCKKVEDFEGFVETAFAPSDRPQLRARVNDLTARFAMYGLDPEVENNVRRVLKMEELILELKNEDLLTKEDPEMVKYLTSVGVFESDLGKIFLN